MKNSKRILLGLLIVTIMIGLFNVVLAFDDDDDIFEPIGNERNNTTSGTPTPTTTTSVNELFNGTTTATPTPTATPARTNNTTNTNTSVYNNTNLPKAGSSDGIVTIVVIAIFGVVALYAYKKIREYNI